MKTRTCLIVASATMLIFAGPGYATTDIEQALNDCKDIEVANKRLNCYDQLANDVANQHASATTPLATPQTTQIASPESLFGQDKEKARTKLEELAGYKEAAELQAKVTEVRKNSRGQFIVTLENGQVWHQFDSKRLRIKIGDMITIEKSRLGSYQLRKSTGSVTLRVRRIS